MTYGMKLALLGLLAVYSPAMAQDQKPEPSPVARETFSDCEWRDVKGGRLAIWSYACPTAYLVADETLPGFGMVEGGAEPGQWHYRPVIRTFDKLADAPIDAVLAEVRKLSPGPATATCVFAPVADPTDATPKRALFELAPTGAMKAAWDRTVETGEGEAWPCGPLGVGLSGNRVFEIMPDDATRVVYIDYGSEIQVFDTSTLR